MTIDELLDKFLDRWTLENVQNLTLKEYVGLGNKDTFCQWVETKTRMLGSIKGMTSIKFGIYERNDRTKKPKNYKNDSQYSWLQGYGDNSEIAFENTKRDLIKVIQLAEAGRFSEIDNILLPNLFKWKVAFLYSNERLIPIYKRDVLFKIAQHFNLKTDESTTISEIQNVMMLNKPAHLNVYAFMWQLFSQFGNRVVSLL
jgi:5-methylcytosine-specific restriction endonuclease McrBC GTP-binding regulatory subunit McrB